MHLLQVWYRGKINIKLRGDMFLFEKSVWVFDYTQQTLQKQQAPPAGDQCAKGKYTSSSKGLWWADLAALLYRAQAALLLEAEVQSPKPGE